jgi:hypothetical protein
VSRERGTFHKDAVYARSSLKTECAVTYNPIRKMRMNIN